MRQGIKHLFFGVVSICMIKVAFALPFNITPYGALPTSVSQGSTVSAQYVVTNLTQSQRNGNFVKYLPPNVSVASGGCGSTFNLTPGASCILNLTVSGAVNGNDSNPQHHLFVCFPGGLVCAGTNAPLNVVVNPVSSTVVPYTSSTTIPYQGIGVATYTVTNNQSSALTISSKNPAYQSTSTNPSGLTVLAETDNCTAGTTLTAGASCQFSVQIANQTSSFTMTPQVCFNNDHTCLSAAAGSYHVTVEPEPQHPAYTYVTPFTGSHANKLVSINPATESIVDSSLTIASGGIQGVAVSLDGTRAYVVTTDSQQVAVVDTSDSAPRLITTFTAGVGPIDLAVTPNDTYVYVGASDGSITCYNVADDTATTVVPPAGGVIYGMRITSDGKKLVASDNSSSQLDIYTINSDGSLTPESYSPIVFSGILTGVNVSPDSSTAYVIVLGGSMNVVSLATGAVTGTISGLGSSDTVAIARDGLTLYTAGASSVDVIDSVSKSITSTVSLGSSFGISIDPTQSYLMVSGDGNRVGIIHLPDNTVTTVDVDGAQSTVGDFTG